MNGFAFRAPGLVLAGVIVLGLPALTWAPAHAQRISCDALHAKVVKSGETPKFTILSKERAVIVQTTEGSCKESVETWSTRNWPVGTGTRSRAKPQAKPKPKAAAKPKTQAKRAPAAPRPLRAAPKPRSEPKPLVPKSASRPRSILPPAPKTLQRPALRTGPCVPMAGQWKPGSYQIGARSYRLAQVFTIDLNNDGYIDNLGFKMVDDKNQEINIRYRARIGETAAGSVVGLKLADESIFERLCFGAVNLKVEPLEKDEELKESLIKLAQPDLAKEFADRQKNKGQPKKAPPMSTTTLLMVAGGGGGAVVVLGLVGFLTRKKWLPASGDEDDEDEDEDGEGGAGRGRDFNDDDEDDDEDRPKGGFMKRFLGKKKDSDDGDDGDEDEDDGEDRPKGGFMKRIFGKKKKSDDDDEEEDLDEDD